MVLPGYFAWYCKCLVRKVQHPTYVQSYSNPDDDARLEVKEYGMSFIQATLNVGHGAFLLFALLVGNHFDTGVPNFGSGVAYALIQCGFGDDLVANYERLRLLPLAMSTYLSRLKLQICAELTSNAHGYLRSPRPHLASLLRDSRFPSLRALDALLYPSTAWSSAHTAPDIQRWKPRIHNIKNITQFCLDTIGWTDEPALLEYFSDVLWPGVILRLLCSVSDNYSMYMQPIITRVF